jgi:EAL and modified HD-GYP domain-containing signal transduction protein
MLQRMRRRRSERRGDDLGGTRAEAPEAPTEITTVSIPSPSSSLGELHGHTLDGPGGTTTYVGRAPVFDRRLGVAGFHLMVDEFGSVGPTAEDFTEARQLERSKRLLTRALLEVGLDSLIGGKLGFVEVPLALAADGAHLALPPHRVMLEVPGPVDRDGLELMRELRDEGYRVIVADVESCEHPPQTARLAAGVRIDGRAPDFEARIDQILRWSPRSQILVSGLRDDTTIERCRTLGVTWLRGDVLRPPDQVDEPTVPTHRVALLQLLAELERPDVDFDDIDRLVSVDLGMSYKLLRMANSSYLALERRVERTRDAVVYLGIDTVRAAAALLALSEASDHPPEIVHLSLVRARHCEEIMKARRPDLSHAAFTTGLFSTLDVLLGLTMEQIMLRIPVADHIADALRDRIGELGRVLEVVCAYERGDLRTMTELGADPAITVLGYRRALAWMASLEKALNGEGRGR